MGERKGQNHYYPPDFNYKTHRTLNAYHGVHALRERARKIKDGGGLIIRFEMPFNVWCLSCNNHVGMGVRYNAEKKKVGNYYTTPIFEFRMKCHLCDGYYTIRTDPKNFDYELVDGLRRQEKRFDSGQLDNVAPVDRGLNQRLAADAMYKAEHGVDDKKKLETVESQIGRLECIQSRLYDDYTANAILRRNFRGEKKALNERRAADDELKKRLSLQNASFKLLPESRDDLLMAKHLSRTKGEGVPRKPTANRPGSLPGLHESFVPAGKEITLETIDRQSIFSEGLGDERIATTAPGTSKNAMALLERMAVNKKRHTDAGCDESPTSSRVVKQQRSLGIVLPRKSAPIRGVKGRVTTTAGVSSSSRAGD